MWKKSYSKTYPGIRKEDIWSLWADVNHWIKWHDDLDECKMEGPFVTGNCFFMKPKGMKSFKIMLTEVIPGQQFTDCTSFFGAKMYDTHQLEETKEGLRISSTLTVTGPLQWLWVKLVAQYVANSTAAEMEALVNQARSHHE